MTILRFLSLGLAVVLLAANPTRAQQIQQEGDAYVRTTTRSFDVSSGGQLVLDGHVGSITVSSWDQNTVEVRETARLEDVSRDEAERYWNDHPTSYDSDGNTVRVQVRGDDNDRRWRRADVRYTFDVRVPRAFSTDLRTAAGSIDVEGLQGQVDARTAGGSISVRHITGDIDITTAGGSLTIDDVDGTVEGQTAGGSIDVRGATGPVDIRTAGGSLRVEDAGNDVDAETSGGSIRIEQVTGRLNVRTSGGDIEVTDAQQDVRARTSGGDIELEGIGGTLEAATSGGDIEGRGFGGRMDVRTSAGDIELQDVRAGVDARTSVGDIEVEITITDATGDYASTLETSHGDIRLALPANLPATIDAEVESYYGRADREDIYSDFPLTRQMSNGDGELRANGTLNGGGPTFELTSHGGSIRIEKKQ